MKKKSLFIPLLLCTMSMAIKESNSQVLALSLYDEELITQYVWKSDYSYQEAVMVVEEEDGSIAPIKLLYNIDRIEEVKSATLTKTYKEGVDYSVEDGKLIVNPSGSIPTISYNDFYPDTGQSGFEREGGGYLCFHEGAYFHNLQIVVSYYHSDEYKGYIPESKGYLLPNITKALKEKEEFNILVYGDSISTGGNSSGHPQINVSPHMPIYPLQIKLALEQKYNIKVNVVNESVGGTDSAWGLANVRTNIFDKHGDEHFDMIVIAFGMNDIKVEPEQYANNIKRLSNALLKKYDNSDCLLYAPMIPNPQAINFNGKQYLFKDELLKLETTGIAVVDMTSMHQSLLQTKRFFDMTGNNVNHANDYLARIYAQVAVKTLEEGNIPPTEPNDDDSSNTSSEIDSTEETSTIESVTQEESTTEIASSETSSTIEETISSNIENQSDNQEKTKKGCKGSIVDSFLLSLFGFIALIILKKGKREYEK